MTEPAPNPVEQTPRPLFIYGTLCAEKLLAWALTGDATNVDKVPLLAQSARVSSGYKRYTVKNCDYPAVIERNDPTSTVNGYLLQLNSGEPNGETVDADVYLWNRGPRSAFERGMAATNVRRYEVGGLA